MKYCKQCGLLNSDPNQKFCNKRCRILWERKHKVITDISKVMSGRGYVDIDGNLN